MKKTKILNKFFLTSLAFVLICCIYVAKLAEMQITSVEVGLAENEKTYMRREAIQAIRGEIFDRNGKLLVANDYSQTVQFDYEAMQNTKYGKNAAIESVLSVLDKFNVPVETQSPFDGTYPHVSYNSLLELTRIEARLKNYIKRAELPEDIECIELYEYLLDAYKLRDDDGNFTVDAKYVDNILKIRYDMDTCNFAPSSPYVIVEDAQIELLTALKEQACDGIYIYRDYERVYCYPGTASHILGRVGSIPKESVDEYTQKGYELDAIVGVDGAELAFEEQLRGIDGVKVIETDEDGNVINTYVEKEPVAGLNIWLTIDIDLQIEAERLLEENIKKVAADALASGKENTGEDADSGAVVMQKTDTCEVLALASYPTYDLSTFSEDYSTLIQDETRPLYNRALLGSYAPGSTFKVAVSAAALTNGLINASTTVYDPGFYKFYEDYQPKCWYSGGHGTVNVVSALGYSCNIFFFDVGRQLGIEKLNDYCSQLGLGEHTGIELNEAVGVLSSPEHNEENGLGIWYPGDTLQASIGQLHTATTPLQISSYISTVLNSGTRYKSTIFYKSETYSGQVVEQNEPVVLNTVKLSDSHLSLIKQGMKMSKENTGSLYRYKFEIGSKTGTAQVDKNNNNALLTAFAPYDDPEITIACVVEDGFTGGNAGHTVLGLISYYFGLDSSGRPLE